MRVLPLLILFAWSHAASSQVILPPDQDTTEWRGWTGIQLQWRPVKTVTVAFQEQWRWRDDFTRFDRRFHQFGVEWNPKSPNASLDRILKPQSLAVGLRRSTRPDNRGDVQGVDKLLRWQVEHGMELEAGRWEFKTRVRCQQQTALALKGGEDPADYGQRRTWRFKGTVSYNIKGWKWDPAVSVERFVDRVPEGWQPDGAWRMRLATGRKLAKRQKVSLFIQRDWIERYNPAASGVALVEIGAGLDDLRLFGAEEWTVGLMYSLRLTSPKRKGA